MNVAGFVLGNYSSVFKNKQKKASEIPSFPQLCATLCKRKELSGASRCLPEDTERLQVIRPPL